jgi:hypothetical protein
VLKPSTGYIFEPSNNNKQMKTVYSLLILLLAFSLGNAQSNSNVEIETNKTISVSLEDTTSNTEVITVKENNTLLIDASELKKSVARSSSDIRIYLNRKRKAGNISFVFPKINKAVKA